MNIEELREEIIKKVKEGILPDKRLINLYKEVKELKIPKRADYEFQIENLSKYYLQASVNERAIINNLLFILEFLNGEKEALKHYIKRSLIIYTHIESEDFKLTVEFLREYPLEERVIEDVAKELIREFFQYSKADRRAIFVNFLVILWNNKANYASKLWLNVFKDLVWLLDELEKREEIEEFMYVHFFTYHVYGNNIQTIDEWRVFNEVVERKGSKFFKKWGEKNNLLKSKKEVSKNKKKIAFLLDRIVLNSPFMVTYSLIKSLLSDKEFRKKYEIYLYSISYVEKEVDDKNLIEQLSVMGVNIISMQDYFISEGYYYSHLKKALFLREKIIKDEIDYLISGFGYDIPNFIFSNRSAPKQIFWSHGNCTSEVEDIDIRMSHFEQQCKDKEWKIFNISIAEEFLIGSEEDKRKGKLIKDSLLEAFGEDTVFLGTIGRYVKIDSDEYIKVIAEIMKENPNTVYLACGGGDKQSIIEKLKKYKIDEKRFIFTGLVNPHQFGWVIDVWSETFPLRQGNSRNEFEAKGGAIIGYKKFYTKEAIEDIEEIAKTINFSPLADTLKEFVEKTSKVIQDKNLRENVGKLYLKLIKKYSQFNKESFLKAIGD
jgi:hypothetical protein